MIAIGVVVDILETSATLIAIVSCTHLIKTLLKKINLELVNDDINDDIQCVKKIYGVHGFSAWVAWNNYCRGRDLSNYQVKECF